MLAVEAGLGTDGVLLTAGAAVFVGAPPRRPENALASAPLPLPPPLPLPLPAGGGGAAAGTGRAGARIAAAVAVRSARSAASRSASRSSVLTWREILPALSSAIILARLA